MFREFAKHQPDWTSDRQYLVIQLASPSAYVRQQASGLLASVGMLIPEFTLDSRSLTKVYELLHDPVARNRVNALRILGYSVPPKPHLTADQIPYVAPLLDDESTVVRKTAVEKLLLEAPLRSDTVATVLARFERDTELQDTIIQTLGKAKIDTPPTASVLIQSLKTRTGDSVLLVLDAIRNIGGATGRESIPAVRAIAESDTTPSVKAAAVSTVRAIDNVSVRK